MAVSQLSDREIRGLCEGVEHPMIYPFEGRQVRYHHKEERVVSYGLSSYGYDIRAADEFRIFSPTHGDVVRCVDPKRFDPLMLVTVRGTHCFIPPNSFCLARSVEHFILPRDVFGLVTAKSTYARCGIFSPPTVLEPGWEGILTLEISNTTPLPAKVYAMEGIAQVIFFRGEPCEVSYEDRGGRYQGQLGIRPAEV